MREERGELLWPAGSCGSVCSGGWRRGPLLEGGAREGWEGKAN